jgi:polyisoprenoid-binding protein YceI
LPAKNASVLAALLLFATGSPFVRAVSSSPIDTAKSVITVRVLKAGLFSAFGHEHEVRAPISQGTITEGDNPSVELTVDARQLRLMDTDLSPKDYAEVQSTMLGAKVLDIDKFPQIQFRSTRVQKLATGKWKIEGDLTLHGQTHPVEVEVSSDQGHYRGSATVRQKDFGITPVTAGGGTIKVKNEVRVSFDLLAR